MPTEKQLDVLRDAAEDYALCKEFDFLKFVEKYDNAAWVDLRKEPENLPKSFEAVEIAVINENGECFECEALRTQRFSESAFWRNGDMGVIHNVIAWRYLPKFKE